MKRRIPNVTEMLDTALNVFKKHFQDILIITLIIYIPVNIILEFVPIPEINTSEDIWRSLQMNYRVMQILEGVFGIIAAMAVIYITAESLKGKIVGWKEALNYALSRWWPQFSTGVVQKFFLLFLFLALIIPGVIFAGFWTFTFHIVTLRDKKWLAALRESKSLVQGRWWQIVGYFILFFIIELIAAAVITAALLVVPDQPALNVVTNLIFDVIAHYFIILATILFLNAEKTAPHAHAKEVVHEEKKEE